LLPNGCGQRKLAAPPAGGNMGGTMGRRFGTRKSEGTGSRGIGNLRTMCDNFGAPRHRYEVDTHYQPGQRQRALRFSAGSPTASCRSYDYPRAHGSSEYSVIPRNKSRRSSRSVVCVSFVGARRSSAAAVYVLIVCPARSFQASSARDRGLKQRSSSSPCDSSK